MFKDLEGCTNFQWSRLDYTGHITLLDYTGHITLLDYTGHNYTGVASKIVLVKRIGSFWDGSKTSRPTRTI